MHLPDRELRTRKTELALEVKLNLNLLRVYMAMLTNADQRWWRGDKEHSDFAGFLTSNDLSGSLNQYFASTESQEKGAHHLGLRKTGIPCILQNAHRSRAGSTRNTSNHARCSLATHQPFHSQEWSISNFPCSLTRNITPPSMEKLLFTAYSDERWLRYQFSLPHSYNSL